jgi:hypothetical protein
MHVLHMWPVPEVVDLTAALSIHGRAHYIRDHDVKYIEEMLEHSDPAQKKKSEVTASCMIIIFNFATRVYMLYHNAKIRGLPVRANGSSTRVAWSIL